MPVLSRVLSLVDRISPPQQVSAHCDLPCGVYDPAQARVEAESVKAIQEKYQASSDDVFKERAIGIKEERADLVKHHLWVLWTDYFKPPHLEKYPLAPPAVLGRHQGGRRHQELDRPGQRPEAARPHRRDRHHLLGDQEGLIPPGVGDSVPHAAANRPLSGASSGRSRRTRPTGGRGAVASRGGEAPGRGRCGRPGARRRPPVRSGPRRRRAFRGRAAGPRRTGG